MNGLRLVQVLADSTGGIGTHVTDLSARLGEQGIAPSILTTTATAAHFRFPPDVPVQAALTTGARGLSPQALAQIRHRTHAFDVVHAHGEQAGALAALAWAGRSGPPLIISRHNAILTVGVRARAARMIQAFAYRGAALVTGASSDLVEQARSLGASVSELAEVPSPRVPQLLARAAARESARAQARAELGLGDQWLALTIARLAPQKRLDRLVHAAAVARSAQREQIWAVLGSGPESTTTELAQLNRELGAPVRFVGHADPLPWLAAADVFILTSEWEARALVVQEALASGVPAVSTEIAGVRDLTGDDAALLVDQGDEGTLSHRLAQAAERVRTEPQLAQRLADAGRSRAQSWPTSEDVAKDWARRYRKLAGVT